MPSVKPTSASVPSLPLPDLPQQTSPLAVDLSGPTPSYLRTFVLPAPDWGLSSHIPTWPALSLHPDFCSDSHLSKRLSHCRI